MRTDTANFTADNVAASKEPRYVIEMAFDDAATDVHYYTSHSDAALPGGATSTDGVVELVSGTTQRTRPENGHAEIGSLSFKLVDLAEAVTDKIYTKSAAGYGLRNKRVRFYLGYKGAVWADYSLIQTQRVEKITTSHGGYRVQCYDLQRAMRKDLFTSLSTTLSSDVGISDTTINIVTGTNDDFTMVAHGTSYSDAPGKAGIDISAAAGDNSFNATSTSLSIFEVGQTIITRGFTTAANNGTFIVVSVTATKLVVSGGTLVTEAAGDSVEIDNVVGYIHIEDETIRWISKTTSTFVTTAAGRGVLGTAAAAHVVDPYSASDRTTTVDEWVYLEMPAVKLAYALLTGDLYGQGTETLPAHWHLGIDTGYVRQSDFTGAGTDWWDTSDDTLGVVVLFQGMNKEDGKKLIEKDIMLLLGAFMPIYGDGALGLKRMVSVLSGSSYVAELDADNIISHGDLTHDMTAVRNQIRIDWNWRPDLKKYDRSNILIDADSVTKHGGATEYKLAFRGLNAGRHTYNTLVARFDSIRDRVSAPPLRLSVTVLPSMNALEVGDVVRVNTDTLRDYNTGNAFDRPMEIQQVSIDWMNGGVKLDLFGSSEAAAPIADAATSLPDSWYERTGVHSGRAGTDLAAYGGVTITVTGGVGHITGGTGIVGGASSASSIFYYKGDLTLDSGVTLPISDNVRLEVEGHLTINGTFDGKGGGFAGGAAETAGTAGYIGDTQGGGKVNEVPFIAGIGRFYSYAMPQANGSYSSFPVVDVVYSSDTLTGVPDDIRGTSGSGGGGIYLSGSLQLAGGAGGNGGAGLIVISRGCTFGASGAVDLSGDDGVTRTTSGNVYAGTGGGGAPGGLLFLLDGSTATRPSPFGKFIADLGDSLVQGEQFTASYVLDDSTPSPAKYSYYAGFGAGDRSTACVRIQYIPAA